MQRGAGRAWMALTALELSDAELRDLSSDFKNLSFRDLKELLRKVGERGLLAVPPDEPLEGPSARSDIDREPRITASQSKVARRISDLLRREAGLSPPEGASLLLGAFPEAVGRITASPGKIGFVRWLERLLAIVPETAILQFVQIYLGRRRSGVESDWRLGSR